RGRSPGLPGRSAARARTVHPRRPWPAPVSARRPPRRCPRPGTPGSGRTTWAARARTRRSGNRRVWLAHCSQSRTIAAWTDTATPPERAQMRMVIAARHRFAEDRLAAAVAAGTTQLVLLGAGLDTSAYRNPHAGLRVFEVDHPQTQQWKGERLAGAGITAPP